MSTRDLAKALAPGISASWVSKVENESLSPSYDKIKKIADYFENFAQTKDGAMIGKIAKEIISFNVGDDIKKISDIMSKKGISQVLILQRKEPVGMLTDKIILKIPALEEKNRKVIKDNLDPIPPKIQYEEPIKKVRSFFDLYSYIFVEKNGDISGIVTRQDMIDAGFKTRNP